MATKPSWINVNPSSGTGGGSVDVTASDNTGNPTRSGTLTIKTASGLTKTVSVSQESDRFTVSFRGNLWIENSCSLKEDISGMKIDIYLKSSEGDISLPYQISANTQTVPYGDMAGFEIELDQILSKPWDAQPYSEVAYLQLSTSSGDKNFDGYTGGEITFETEGRSGRINEDIEFYTGKLELNTTAVFPTSKDSTTVTITNTESSPIVITEWTV